MKTQLGRTALASSPRATGWARGFAGALGAVVCVLALAPRALGLSESWYIFATEGSGTTVESLNALSVSDNSLRWSTIPNQDYANGKWVAGSIGANGSGNNVFAETLYRFETNSQASAYSPILNGTEMDAFGKIAMHINALAVDTVAGMGYFMTWGSDSLWSFDVKTVNIQGQVPQLLKSQLFGVRGVTNSYSGTSPSRVPGTGGGFRSTGADIYRDNNGNVYYFCFLQNDLPSWTGTATNAHLFRIQLNASPLTVTQVGRFGKPDGTVLSQGQGDIFIRGDTLYVTGNLGNNASLAAYPISLLLGGNSDSIIAATWLNQASPTHPFFNGAGYDPINDIFYGYRKDAAKLYQFIPLANGQLDPSDANTVVLYATGGTPQTSFMNDFGDMSDAYYPTASDPKPGSIGNRIWLDENSNGLQDAGETGIPNVTVGLYDSTGTTLLATTVSDSDGGYLFNDLALGTYVVKVNTSTMSATLAANQTYDPDATVNSATSVTLTTTAPMVLTADFGYNWSPTANVTGNTGTTGAIGDRVWIDADGDGRQDPGEPGLSGISVTLRGPGADGVFGTADDTTVATTTTDAAGNYVFTALAAGAYQVWVNNGATPSGYTQTGDPDAVKDNRTTTPIVLAPGDVYVNADFGYQPSSSSTIGDLVYFDANANGAFEAGTDYGLSGVSVTLLDGSGAVVATTLTDVAGAYQFQGVPSGTYTVWVEDTRGVVAAMRQTADPDINKDRRNTLTVNGSSAYLNEDFGFTAPGQDYSRQTAIIGDTIFLDRNASGSPDAGEGLEGVTVNLYDSTGTVLQDTAVTDANGKYYFGGLGAGTYTVKVDTTTLPGTSGQLTNSTDPDGGTANQSTVTLAAGGTNLAQDFGYRRLTTPNTVGGTIWYDSNADGSLVSGETARFAGVTVVLRTSSGRVVGTATTDGSGNYSFGGLPDGTYLVDVTDDANVLEGLWKSTGTAGADNNSQADPYSVSVSGGATNTTADFGYYDGLPTALGDFVWFDLNNNGIQDSGETGIAGAVVSLAITYPNATVVTLKTVTDGGGLYSFGNLLLDEHFRASGSGNPTFSLSVASPAGFVPTTKFLQGGDPAKDSQNPAGAAATVTKGTNDTTNDFAFTGNGGTIGDRVFLDLNNNNQYDPGEGIGGVSVALSGGATATTTTDANGFYQFNNLPVAAGGTSYTVTVNSGSPPNGLDLSYDPQGTADNRATYTLTPAVPFVDTADFGYQGRGAIGDRVFIGLDNDNVWDVGEGISGVTVTLTGDVDGDGTSETLTTTTDADGYYQFSNLRTTAGGVSYTVTVNGGTAPNGLTQYVDPDATLNNATTVSLTTGTPSVQTADFGYRGTGTVGDKVFADLNRDNAFSSGEGLNGVSVTLTGDVDGDGVVETLTTTTATAGDYLFDYLRTTAAGVSYTVTVNGGSPPGGRLQTVDRDGVLDSKTTVQLTTAAPDILTADFGYIDPGAIGDRIFLDANNNNAWDAGEGISGVTVTIYNNGTGTGTPLATTTTTADGYYQFSNLSLTSNGGLYTVVVTPPNGLTLSFDPQGTADNKASYTLTSGVPSVQTADFGYKGNGSVGDRIFVDLNNNNQWDAGEGINGVTVRLTGDVNGDGVSDSLTTTTSGDGYYLFNNLSVPTSGNLSLTVTVLSGVPSGLTQSYDPDVSVDGQTTVTLNSGAPNVLTADFGYKGNGSVGDRIFSDLNNNNQYDAGEGLSGVTVTLTGDVDGDGVSEVLTTTTDSAGYYQFTNLRVPPSGAVNHTVAVGAGVPGGLTQSYDPDATKDNQTVVALTAANPSVQTADFGYQGSATVGNLVFQDRNDNGLVDAGDTGINGVSVEVWSAGADGQVGGGDDALISTTTTANVGGVDGSYSFKLPAGTYYVRIPTPPASAPLNSAPSFTSGDNRDHGTQAGGSGTAVTTGVFTLGAGTTDNTQDVGFVPTSVLESSVGGGGTIFKDNNLNGYFDAGDTPVANQTIELYRDDNGNKAPNPGAGDNLITTATTDASGRVFFKLLPPGDYFIRVPAATFQSGGSLAGWVSYVGAGDPNDGTDDSGEVGPTKPGDENGLDDANPAANGINTGVFTLAVGTEPVNGTGGSGGSETGDGRLLDDVYGDSNNDLTLDLGFVQASKLGQIGDLVWVDLDGNGQQNSGEPGLPGVRVFVDLNTNGTLDPDEPFATTDSAGAYSIGRLPAGTWIVVVDSTSLPAGLTTVSGDPDATKDGKSSVVLAEAQVRTDVDFGYRGTGSVGDRVFTDYNANNQYDAGEGIAGVTVTLTGDFDGDGVAESVTQTTGTDGLYTFSGLRTTPGGVAYQVAVTSGLPAGLTQSYDPDATVDGQTTVTLTSSAPTKDTADFGYQGSHLISGTVYYDRGTRGEFDAEDTAVPGVTVTLYADKNSDGKLDGGDTALDTRTTDGNGGYSFSNLPDGYYLVVESVPSGKSALKDKDGSLNGNDVIAAPLSGGDNTANNFLLEDSTPTAVRLARFTATARNGSPVRLGWETLVENGTLGFQLERSADGNAWQRFSRQLIPALGRESRPQSYVAWDVPAADGADLKYRLVEVDLEGHEHVLAVTPLSLGMSARLTATSSGWNLEVNGVSDSTVVLEKAVTVEGPWSSTERLVLDSNGNGVLHLPRDLSAPTQFYRVVTE